MKRVLAAFLFLFVMSPFAEAQKGAVKRANKLYEKLSYSEAAAAYEDLLSRRFGKDSVYRMDAALQKEVFANLGNCYYLTQQFPKAAHYYGLLLQHEEVDIRYRLQYAQVLKAVGQCDSARAVLASYLQERPDDRRALAATYSCEDEQSFRQRENLFELQSLGINSEASDFGPAFYDEGIVFTSARERHQYIKRRHAWTDQPFLDLYYSQGEDAASFTPPIRFDRKVNGRFNEGPVTFFNEDEEMYITRNPTKGKNSRRQVTLEIVKVIRSAEEWKETGEITFNDREYSIAHPTLSSDGRYIYFASDMPGGFGGTDLFYCEKFHSGWSEPFNLGPAINTAGNESFPFLYNDGTLYFSSDGHSGVGGLDIFQINKKGTSWGSPRNMGYPVNSTADDFSIIWDGSRSIGYFSSNREGGAGSDDLYFYSRQGFMLMGKVYDWQTRALLGDAEVRIVNDIGQETTLTTDSLGAFSFALSQEHNYEIFVDREGYQTRTKEILGHEIQEDLLMDILVSKDECIPFSGTVFSESGHEAQSGMPVVITNIRNGEKWVVNTDATGTFLIDCADPDGEYVATIPYKEIAVSIEDAVQIYAPMIEEPALVDFCDFEPVFYDDDAATVRAESEAMLKEILRQLLANPALEVELSSHTDVEVSSTENHSISKRRTDGASTFLVENGIASRRIHRNYYGESEFSTIFTEGAQPGENNSRTECRCLLGKGK